MQKGDFFRFKMSAILRNLEQLGPNFALCTGTAQDMCVQNIIQQWLQTNQTHIGPTLHVSPNYKSQTYHYLLTSLIMTTEQQPDLNNLHIQIDINVYLVYM